MRGPVDPWERQPGESAIAYAHLRKFIDAGPRRRINAVARESQRSPALLYRWSRQWSWIARAEAFDREEDVLWQQERRRARRKAADRHAKLATAFLSKVVQRLQSIEPERLSPRDLATWLEVASKLERAAYGEVERIECPDPTAAPSRSRRSPSPRSSPN